MQELVGHCIKCNKPIMCEDGFLNGIVVEDKTLICFECSEEEQSQSTFALE
ncbi:MULTISPECIES: hypothetical protein [unclassified Paenibacillus]|uniref:hypothetical protein n=1 Tax=unclassified Paenibacillus TaxID=185978 RepID=UPI003637EE39